MNNSDNRKERKETHEGHSLGEMVWRGAFRFSRSYQQGEEFNKRQECLEFGEACRFVNELIASVKKTITAYATGVIKNFRMERAETKKPEQLKLNLLGWIGLERLIAA